MRKLLWVIPLLALGTFGCRARGSESVTAPTAVKVPDMEAEDESGVTRYYNAENGYTERVLEEMAGTYDVRAERQRFEQLGYRYRGEHSFVVEGIRPDGERAEIVVLAMENTAAPETDAVFLFSLTGRYRHAVVPTRLARAGSAPGRDWQMLREGLWFSALDPLWDPAGGAGLGAARFSWRQWAICLSQALASALAGCTITCAVLPVAFPQCMIACVEGNLMRALLDCTFEQF